MKNFFQNSVKTALRGAVGSERVWDTSQQARPFRQAIARTGRFTEMGIQFLCLLRSMNSPEKGMGLFIAGGWAVWYTYGTICGMVCLNDE